MWLHSPPQAKRSSPESHPREASIAVDNSAVLQAQHDVLLAQLAELQKSVDGVKEQLRVSLTEAVVPPAPVPVISPPPVTTPAGEMPKRHLVLHLDGDREMYRHSAHVLAEALQVSKHLLSCIIVLKANDL